MAMASVCSTGGEGVELECCPDPPEDARANADPVVNLRCGWRSWRPSCFRRFSTAPWLLTCICCAAVVQGVAVNGLVNASLSSLERRFELSASQLGLLPSFYDVVAAFLLALVGYYGARGNRPRWLAAGLVSLAVGSFVFALPHFTTDRYQFTLRNRSGLCSSSPRPVTYSQDGALPTDQCFQEDESNISSLSRYWYVFILANLLFGTACAPLYSLGPASIDESVPMESVGLYLGIFSFCWALGPAIGFTAAGVILDKVYTDYFKMDTSSLGIDSSNREWIGAWWLGFLLCSIFALLLALIISCFPVQLPDSSRDDFADPAETKQRRCQRSSQAHTKSGVEIVSRKDFGLTLRDMPTATKLLFRNPTYMLLNLALTADMIFLSGSEAFLPKFLESQFGVSSGDASLIVGVIATIAGGGTVLFSGWIVKRYNMKIPALLKLCAVVTVVDGILMLGLLLRCDEIPLAGVFRDYHGNRSLTGVSLESACNAACDCASEPYSPVCGDNEMIYFSACHAGCLSYNDQTDIYGDCQCTDASDSTVGGATPGLCPSSCRHLWFFIVILTAVIVFYVFCGVPALNIILRCVPDGQQAYAMGLHGFLVWLGSIPGPIIFGYIFDVTCTLWHRECLESGQCWFYNRTDLSLYVTVLGVAVKGVVFGFYCLALYFHTPMTSQDARDAMEDARRKDATKQGSLQVIT